MLDQCVVEALGVASWIKAFAVTAVPRSSVSRCEKALCVVF